MIINQNTLKLTLAAWGKKGIALDFIANDQDNAHPTFLYSYMINDFGWIQ